ncbi:related to Flavin carrier protein 2 [Saccharomycodes ludwigii]|uniref:Related to Flavin carrier protein 2 n=1 Tax=Saccharomycodes ludwigii TaxID=36035 RepID=A0A376B7A6_9ASCO|nr:hypothetical protein SCDLUD_004947 [Saccharomycodes ludwigii]KAH3899502.1 hypothetical protein SCDLUD_004947 [Saccharomycodes ludwigii]SSD60364.1 related to Flavin carrier protein 2 [Saccharomycodes ludwigii]
MRLIPFYTLLIVLISQLCSYILAQQDTTTTPNTNTDTTTTNTNTDTTTTTNTNTDTTNTATTSTSTSSSSSSTSNSTSSSVSDANARHLRTSSLLTCMQNSKFTATLFDVAFYPGNNSVVFDIEATTTIASKVKLEIEVIAYGLNIIQKSMDLCSLKVDSICPLSAGRIDVSGSYTINSDIVKQIPGVAYTIPDLDASVRVLVYDTDDDDDTSALACVEAILSNGKTVQTKYAAWPIAAVSGLGVLTSGFISVMGQSLTAAHIASNSISLFVYFQNLAITAMMAVSRVPPIAAAWTQNFQWSMGIINVEFMQKILKWYVQSTSGTSLNIIPYQDVLSISVQKKRKRSSYVLAKNIFDSLSKRAVSLSSSVSDNIFDDSSLYTENEKNATAVASKILLLRGIEAVAFKAGIELSNVFLTGIVFLLFFIFCIVVGLIFFKSLVELFFRTGIMNSQTSKFFEYRRAWGSIIKGTLYRVAIIAFPQVTLLTIWEFTEFDSVACIVDAIVLLAIFVILLSYGSIKVIRRGFESSKLYKNPAYLLYGDANFLNKFGFLYVQFKADMYWWLLPLLSYSLLRSIFVAVLQQQGKAQALIIFIIEIIYLAVLCWKRPYMDKRTNAFNICIHVINSLNSLFFLFFSTLFGQPQVVSSVMAVVLFVLNAVFALFLLIFTIVTCCLALLHRNPDTRYQPMKDDRVSFIPRVMTNDDGTVAVELKNLGKVAMTTNETEDQLAERNNAFIKHNNMSSRKLLLDEEEGEQELTREKSSDDLSIIHTLDDSNSTFSSRQLPTSAISGFTNTHGNSSRSTQDAYQNFTSYSNFQNNNNNNNNNNNSYRGHN